MNERIKQLARQVDACYIPRYDMWQMDTESLKKFAELIVRECVQSIEKTIETNCDTDSEQMGCEFAITDLLEHFGVEE